MEEEQQLSFILEWYDPQSDQLKPYILHYHGDNTVEMVRSRTREKHDSFARLTNTSLSHERVNFALQIERHTKRIFLKRIRIPTVTLDALVPGGSITVYSRQLTVVDAANEYTKQIVRKRANKALFVVRPGGYAHMGKVIQAIEASGLVLLNTVMVQLERPHVNALAMHCANTDTLDDTLRDVSVLVEVKQSTPSVLEGALSRLEAARVKQFVLVGEIGLHELYGGVKAPPATTAVFDNCSVCLLRPRMVRDGRVGFILDAILSAGFEISALKMMHLEMNGADEFFRVYKGIVRQYHVRSGHGRAWLMHGVVVLKATVVCAGGAQEHVLRTVHRARGPRRGRRAPLPRVLRPV